MNKINVPLAAMSIVLSLLLWVNVFNSRSVRSRTQVFSAKINMVNLDDTKFLVSDSPENVSVTVAGSTAQVRTVMGLEVFGYVDLTQARPGTSSYPVVVYPPNVRDLLVNPTVTARIKTEPLVVKKVSVTVNRMGAFATGSASIESVETSPRNVYVAGTSDALQRVSSVAVNVDLNDETLKPEGVMLEAKAIDLTGKVVPKVMISPTGKDIHYKEETVAAPYLVRVWIKQKSPVSPGSPPQ